MRRQENRQAAYVVLKHPRADLYLVRWNANWGDYGFVGGKREVGDADLRATAAREAREELGLELGADYELEHAATVVEFEGLSKRTDRAASYHLEAYAMVLTGHESATLAQLDAAPDLRWVSPQEVRRGTTDGDGRAIAEPVARALLSHAAGAESGGHT